MQDMLSQCFLDFGDINLNPKVSMVLGAKGTRRRVAKVEHDVDEIPWQMEEGVLG
jgi:hypothetical protein